MPKASALLRLLAFAVPAALAMAGIQPLLGAAAGAVGAGWAFSLTVPAVAAAALIFGVGRLRDRGDAVQPPWYSAWLLLPGSFLLAGSAAMCIFGALVEYPGIPPTMWTLLAVGSLGWTTAIVLVRHASH
jgi:hypothetical protein